MNTEPGMPGDGLPARASAGTMLRAAREAHGLTVETVAHHLKLAPRQVRAIENDAYGDLPGRTFVRGFTRNYAKLLQLDADDVVAALPAAMAPAIADDNPATITPGARPMGPMPVSEERERTGWSRWVIAIVLIALVGFAAVYELTRKGPLAPEDAPAVAKPAPNDPIGPSVAGGGGTTALPNPLTSGDGPAPAAPADVAPAAPAADVTTPSPAPSTAPATSPAPAAAAAAATLVIAYRAAAWTEVRDGNGDRLLVGTMPAGTSQTVTGVPPFDVTLGNALQTSVTWRGAPFDLAPHIKANIARLRLQ